MDDHYASPSFPSNCHPRASTRPRAGTAHLPQTISGLCTLAGLLVRFFIWVKLKAPMGWAGFVQPLMASIIVVSLKQVITLRRAARDSAALAEQLYPIGLDHISCESDG